MRSLFERQLTIEDIVRKHLGFIRSALRQRVPAADVDDVAQRVLMRAHRALLDGHGPAAGRVRTWLFAIIKRAVQDYRRGLDRPDVELHEALAMADALANAVDPTPDSEASMSFDEDRRFLEEVLARMPEERREVFEWCDLCGMTTNELADAMSIPDGTVKARLRVARLEVRAAFKRRQAEQKASGALVLAISAEALVARVREELLHVPDEVFARTWARLQEAIQAEEAASPGAVRPSLDPAPPVAPSRSPDPSRLGKVGRAAAFAGGLLVGGVIVYLLMRHDHATAAGVVCSAVTSPGATEAQAVAGSPPAPPAPVGVASATLPAGSASLPVIVTPASLPDVLPPMVASDPHASPHHEEDLMRSAMEALQRADVDTVRANLDHHVREFPQGRLKATRDLLLSKLPY